MFNNFDEVIDCVALVTGFSQPVYYRALVEVDDSEDPVLSRVLIKP